MFRNKTELTGRPQMEMDVPPEILMRTWYECLMLKLLVVESVLGINSSLPIGERPLEQGRTVEGGTEETESGVGNEQVT